MSILRPETNLGFYFPYSYPFPAREMRSTFTFVDGALLSQPERPLVRTGPIELRDRGPNGRPLGTHDDIHEDSPWELHRGELVERPASHVIHSVVNGIVTALFHNHVRHGYTILRAIDCILDDNEGESLRIPDVAIVHQLTNLKGAAYRGIPVLAVEVRATQSKKHLEEKVALYLDHNWPTIWLIHTEGRQVEVVRKGLASVVYPMGTNVPMIPELDKYDLVSMPVAAFFDDVEASKYIEAWVEAKGHERGFVDGRTQERANALLDVLSARGLDVPANVHARITSCTDLDTLQHWFALAVTATNAAVFAQAVLSK